MAGTPAIDAMADLVIRLRLSVKSSSAGFPTRPENFEIVSHANISMTAEPPTPYEPPEPSKSRKSTVYKIVMVIILVLLAYWLWKIYTHLPPAHPLQYPAYYSPRSTATPLTTTQRRLEPWLTKSYHPVCTNQNPNRG